MPKGKEDKAAATPGRVVEALHTQNRGPEYRLP